MPVQQNSFTNLRVLLVPTDCGILRRKRLKNEKTKRLIEKEYGRKLKTGGNSAISNHKCYGQNDKIKSKMGCAYGYKWQTNDKPADAYH
jgi:hypothetical protein